MLAEVEKELFDRLSAVLSTLRVVQRPDMEDYATSYPTVQVHYSGSSFSLPARKAMGKRITQTHTLSYQIQVLFDDQRSHVGALPIIETIQRSLAGFRPISLTRSEEQGNFTGACYLDADSFDERNENGYWIYSASVKIQTTFYWTKEVS